MIALAEKLAAKVKTETSLPKVTEQIRVPGELRRHPYAPVNRDRPVICIWGPDPLGENEAKYFHPHYCFCIFFHLSTLQRSIAIWTFVFKIFSRSFVIVFKSLCFHLSTLMLFRKISTPWHHRFQIHPFSPIHTTAPTFSKRCVFISHHFRNLFRKKTFSSAFSGFSRSWEA